MSNPGPSHQAIIDYRRRLVASLLLRGFGVREIQNRLADEDDEYFYYPNPNTGKPWGLGTISRDKTALEDEWRESKEADIEEHKARQLAELREHRRLAWRMGELNEVRLGIGKEMELLGTKAPERSEISGQDGGPIETKNADGLTDEERIERIMVLFERARERRDSESG